MFLQDVHSSFSPFFVKGAKTLFARKNVFVLPTKFTPAKTDDGQITHLICVYLFCYMTFWGGGFWHSCFFLSFSFPILQELLRRKIAVP